jgi:hypothetical protein
MLRGPLVTSPTQRYKRQLTIEVNETTVVAE